mgnify:CR=1 FL=1
MNEATAADILSALGNATRLALFRLLVQSGKEGVPVGTLQRTLGIPGSTLSHHLARLVRVGLATQERNSRTLICRAEYECINSALSFVTEHCCQGLGLAIQRRAG